MYLIRLIKMLGKVTRASLAFGASLIVYGYLCRWFHLYFFWESLPIGSNITLLVGIGVLNTWNRHFLAVNNLGWVRNLLTGIIVFVFFIQALLAVFCYSNRSYSDAIVFLGKEPRLIEQIGEVNSFSLVPQGAIEAKDGTTYTTLTLIAKGRTQYVDITVYLTQGREERTWKVEGYEVND